MMVEGITPLRTIQDYFDRIETSIAAGDATLAQRDPAQAVTIKTKCTEAALLIASYNLYVHRAVFEPLMDSPDTAVRKRVCLLKAECIALTEDLREGVKTLAANEAPIDFDTLSVRVETFNTRVRRHIAAVVELLGSSDGLRIAA